MYAHCSSAQYRVGNSLFCSFVLCSFTLLKRAIGGNRSCRSLLKERFNLFESGLCSFLKRKLSHFLALLLQKPKESTSPFLKRAIHSRRSLQHEQKEQVDRSFLSKNKRFAQKTKERMPNPASMECVKNYTAGVG